MEATGYTVFVLGAVCLIAAIVGGNVSLPGGVRFAALASKGARIALGFFAFLLLGVGAIFIAAPVQSPNPEASGDSTVGRTHQDPFPFGGCDDPKITLSKGKGASGLKITITGSGFPKQADVTLRFHTEAMAPAATEDDGTFKGKVKIPGSFDPFAPQQFDITASTTSPSVCSARAAFKLID